MKINNSKVQRNSEGINLPFISTKNKGVIQNQTEVKKEQIDLSSYSNNYNQKITNQEASSNFSRNMVRNGRRDSYSIRNEGESLSVETNYRSGQNSTIMEPERNQVMIPTISPNANSKYKKYSISHRNNHDYYKQANLYKQQHVGLRRENFSERRAFSENSHRNDNSRDGDVYSLDRKPAKPTQLNIDTDIAQKNFNAFPTSNNKSDQLHSDRSWGSQNSHYYKINNIKAPPI